ncbi:hypothetical protein BGX38DRAFT_1211489 [Terfezia claveryi]|nr:hypothetical protein BGX38DRAFT_1211489 [Terfezia claveryi]
MISPLAKSIIWVLRFFQWSFAVIIMAVTAYFIHQFRSFGYHGARETVVPLIFSILAIIFTTFSIIGLYFLSFSMQLLSTLLDIILWVGYLASAGLLRHNYHVRGRNNLLWQKLYYGRTSVGQRPRGSRNNALVQLLAALVVIQVILFFFTMLLQLWVAKKNRDQQRLSGTTKRFSRSTAGSEVTPMADTGGVHHV